MWLLLTCIFVRLLYTEYIISSRIVKITLCLPVESLKPTPRSISIFTCKLPNLYSLDKKLCERRPEGDLIGFETESWKTQGKTTSWHPPESEENWVPTQPETGWTTWTDKWYRLAGRHWQTSSRKNFKQTLIELTRKILARRHASSVQADISRFPLRRQWQKKTDRFGKRLRKHFRQTPIEFTKKTLARRQANSVQTDISRVLIIDIGRKDRWEPARIDTDQAH